MIKIDFDWQKMEDLSSNFLKPKEENTRFKNTKNLLSFYASNRIYGDKKTV